MDLIAFAQLPVFTFLAPDKVTPSDAAWRFDPCRRLASLGEDDVALAEHFEFTGDYPAAIRHAETALARPQLDRRQCARVLLAKCGAHLALANGPAAEQCVYHLRVLDGEEAIATLAEAINRARNGNYARLLKDDLAARAVQQLREADAPDLVIRGLLERARVLFADGHFFRAVDVAGEAFALICESGDWRYVGQFQALLAGTAADQGYRQNIQRLLDGALAWCDYLGDAPGRIESLVHIGRLMGYQMPSGDPRLAAGPSGYLEQAAAEAEARGMVWTVGNIDNLRSWLYRKAGDEARRRELLGLDAETPGDRERLAAERNEESEKIADTIRINNASRLHDGIEDSQDVFLVFNALRDSKGVCRDLNWVYANRAASTLFSGGELQIWLYSEATRLPAFAGLDEGVARAVDQRESFEDVREISGPRWLQRRVVPSGDGIVISLRDITAEKRIESALRAAAESAERSERAKTEFLASMSHEIRTPLNGVLGLARMLAETNLDDRQRGYVQDIMMSGDLLLELIGGVLDLSKLETQGMSLNPTPVVLHEMVESIIKLLRAPASEHHTDLSFRIEPSVPETVYADGVRLRQILTNLAGNAVKFTREGKVEVEVSMDAGLVRFDVRDTGVGIPPDRMEHIFDRFQQAGDPAFGGTGLGLTIARALVELMRGEIRVESKPGLGSTFIVRLPLRAVKAPTAPEAAAALRFDGSRVLLVDDNRVNVLVSSHALRKFGCSVTLAEDGSQALDRLEREAFDLVFMDVRMPAMNGLEATRELRRREGSGRRTPVVALTAGALLQERQECFDAGMDDFATKPISPDAIRDVLARWLLSSK